MNTIAEINQENVKIGEPFLITTDKDAIILKGRLIQLSAHTVYKMNLTIQKEVTPTTETTRKFLLLESGAVMQDVWDFKLIIAEKYFLYELRQKGLAP